MTPTTANRPKKITYPNNRLLLVHDCTVDICLSVNPGAVMLSVLLFWYENPWQGDYEEEDEEGHRHFTMRRTQAQIETCACRQINVKTIHDTAVPLLTLLGYLSVFEQIGGNYYTLHVDRVTGAYAAYKKGPLTLRTYLKSLMQLESAPIHLSERQIEAVLIKKGDLYSQLKETVIAIRGASNCRRGPKPRKEAPAGGESTAQESALREESEHPFADGEVDETPPPAAVAADAAGGASSYSHRGIQETASRGLYEIPPGGDEEGIGGEPEEEGPKPPAAHTHADQAEGQSAASTSVPSRTFRPAAGDDSEARERDGAGGPPEASAESAGEQGVGEETRPAPPTTPAGQETAPGRPRLPGGQRPTTTTTTNARSTTRATGRATRLAAPGTPLPPPPPPSGNGSRAQSGTHPATTGNSARPTGQPGQSAAPRSSQPPCASMPTQDIGGSGTRPPDQRVSPDKTFGEGKDKNAVNGTAGLSPEARARYFANCRNKRMRERGLTPGSEAWERVLDYQAHIDARCGPPIQERPLYKQVNAMIDLLAVYTDAQVAAIEVFLLSRVLPFKREGQGHLLTADQVLRHAPGTRTELEKLGKWPGDDVPMLPPGEVPMPESAPPTPAPPSPSQSRRELEAERAAYFEGKRGKPAPAPPPELLAKLAAAAGRGGAGARAGDAPTSTPPPAAALAAAASGGGIPTTPGMGV